MNTKINNDNTNKIIRNSGVELLRIFAMFSIIICHVYASDKNITGYNGYIMVIVNSLFNAGTGVVIFMLISGYYSIKLSVERFNAVYSKIIVCVITTYLLNIFIAHDPSIKINYFIPVLSSWQWYISCYVYTMLLSPFLNLLCDKMIKSLFQKLLLALITLFYILPTFLYFTITNDEGKGFVYMVIAYLVGRYLRLYKVNIRKKHLMLSLFVLLTVNTVGNLSTAYIIGKMKWLFSRDLTIVTLLTAVTLLLLSLKSDIRLKTINNVAKNNLFVYLLMINYYIVIIFDITKFYKSPLLLPVCIAVAIISYIISLVLAYPLNYISIIISKIMTYIEKIFIKAYKVFSQRLSKKLELLASEITDSE